MNEISISKVTWKEGKVFQRTHHDRIYFPNETLLLTTADTMLTHGAWKDSGQWQLSVRGSQTNVFYADCLPTELTGIICQHRQVWDIARALARYNHGEWTWCFSNDFFKRAATLRYFETATKMLGYAQSGIID